jgi:uncharacterized membrane protein
MDLGRIARHLLFGARRVRSAFPQETLAAIESAIKASEAAHTGEIRFAVEGALDGAPLFAGQSPRERAIDVFSALRIWDTERNNGVLIYVLLADRDVEIVADRGVAAVIAPADWQSICNEIEAAFREGKFEQGSLAGVRAVTERLTRHFPASGADRNELPDRVVVL